VAVDSQTEGESVLYDVGRYEVRTMIMSSPGANAPVVFGGKIRAILAEVDPTKMEARGLSLTEVLKAIEGYNLFLPTGDASIGRRDYAIDSNSMYQDPLHMADIPLRVRPGAVDFLGDVARTRDSHLIQMSAVRVNGRREVYVPVYRQQGASTLKVVDNLRSALPDIQARLSKPDVKLKMVMDQSVYVRQSIHSLAVEGILGAVLCSLVIFVFLGEWRLTAIAVLLIPLAVLAAVLGLYALGETINVMTLAGLALAIGPLVDIAIVVLENTHRHLRRGTASGEAARRGAGEVILPELVATGATLLVLAPLALMPGTGQFLFKPLALTVALAMIASYVLAMSFVPSRSANWLRPHRSEEGPAGSGPLARFLRMVHGKVQGGIDAAIRWYTARLDWALKHRGTVVLGAAGLLALVLLLLTTRVRREFFPEADSGAFSIYVRADTGTRLTETEKRVAQVEQYVKEKLGDDVELVVSLLGVWADWSAAYSPNSGPMDALVQVQLTPERRRTSQQCARLLRAGMSQDARFTGLEIAFNTGGTIRSALNLGKTTPLNLSIRGKDRAKARALAERIYREVVQIDGVVDARILQRLNYPEYVVEVDRALARRLGLTQKEVMQNVVAALKSTIQFNKKNFWFDPVTHNQYYVGVQYPEQDIQSLATLLNVSITSPLQKEPIPLSNLVQLRPTTVAAEVTHTDLQATIDLTMNVEGRDLGHVADDVIAVVNKFGKSETRAKWAPYDPESPRQEPMEGARMILCGEYEHMEDTFWNFGVGLALAVVFIYFLMVTLLDSYLIPLVILAAVPVGLVGVLPMLWVTGTALNVQSLQGVIFMVGIVVSNTVLLTDFAEHMRTEQKLSPTEAIRQAAAVRAKPVVMTALVPMALALEAGSEANAPLGRAVIGGLLAGLVTTLFVVPCLFSLLIRDRQPSAAEPPPVPPRDAFRAGPAGDGI
jgi:multidrug efflux pump subunit AcrB